MQSAIFFSSETLDDMKNYQKMRRRENLRKIWFYNQSYTKSNKLKEYFLCNYITSSIQ